MSVNRLFLKATVKRTEPCFGNRIERFAHTASQDHAAQAQFLGGCPHTIQFASGPWFSGARLVIARRSGTINRPSDRVFPDRALVAEPPWRPAARGTGGNRLPRIRKTRARGSETMP